MSDRVRFEDLVLPHLDAGYNLARWMTRDAQDADDVVQDACLRALQYHDALRPEGTRSWFLTVVRHAYYDWIRRNRPAAFVADAEAALAGLADPQAVDPERAVLGMEDRRQLADALAALPPLFREVLVLREFEDLSYKEIAHIVGVPIGTVMSRLARARSLLQAAPQLQEFGRAAA
jgi:RNA polymerase sigma-70 factor (ECF subfamily)